MVWIKISPTQSCVSVWKPLVWSPVEELLSCASPCRHGKEPPPIQERSITVHRKMQFYLYLKYLWNSAKPVYRVEKQSGLLIIWQFFFCECFQRDKNLPMQVKLVLRTYKTANWLTGSREAECSYLHAGSKVWGGKKNVDQKKNCSSLIRMRTCHLLPAPY